MRGWSSAVLLDALARLGSAGTSQAPQAWLFLEMSQRRDPPTRGRRGSKQRTEEGATGGTARLRVGGARRSPVGGYGGQAASA